MSNVEGERTMADLADEAEALMGKTRDRRALAHELSQELMLVRGQLDAVAKLIPAVLFLLDRYAQDI